MTSTAEADRSAAISTTAARLAMGAIISYQIILIVLIFVRPDLDPSWHTISEWAIGRYGWIMSGAFLISAFSYGALFVLLRSQLRGAMGRIGLGLLLICVVGATGVGIFATDPMPLRFPLSTVGTLHVIFGTSQLVLLPFAALLINLNLVRRNQAWAKARRVLLWTAGLPLFGFCSFVLYSAIFVFPLGPQAHGPGVNIGWPPRFAFFTYMLWLVTLAWQAIRCSDQRGAETTVPSRIVAPAAWLAIVMTAATILLLASLHVLSPEFASSWRMVSEYALGHYGWVLSLMFLSWGVSSWALAVAIWSQLKTKAGKVGLWFLVVAGIGEAMASIFDVTHETGHSIAGLLGLGGFPIAALLLSASLGRVQAWRSARKTLLWIANASWISVILLVATLVLMTMQLSQANGGHLPQHAPKSLPPGVLGLDGWANRLIVVSNCLWVFVAAWQAIKLHRKIF